MPVTRIVRRNQCDGFAAVLRAGRSADTVDIVFRVMRHVIIDDQRHIRHVDTARHHIRRHQHIDLAVSEIEHHLVAFVLLQVAMHRPRVDLQGSQRPREVFDALFLAGEDDDFLEVLALQRQLDESGFLRLKDMRAHLVDSLWRTGHSYLYFYRVMHDGFRHLTDLRRHGSREHDGLTVGRQALDDGHDVIIETHVEHAVRFVQDEVFDTGKINVIDIHLAEQTTRRSDDDVRTFLQTAHLIAPRAVGVFSSIYSDRREGDIEPEPFHLLVNLLRQLARRRHDDSVQFVRVVVIVRKVRQQR